MNRKVLNILIVIFTIGVVYELYNYVKELNNSNNKVLENIQIVENLKDSKQIAIKVQNDSFGWDEDTTRIKWPDKDIFEYYGSECEDVNGNQITPTTDILQFNIEGNKATISTDRTIYCTLKFARKSTVLKLMKQTTSEQYLKTAYEGDELLRYVGTQSDVTSNKINNFICFGTENKDICLADKNTYMYRIIGITTENVNTNLGLVKDQLKIIKATSSNDNQGWSTCYTCTSWEGSKVLEYLESTFLTGASVTIGDKSIISNPKWYVGGSTARDGSSEEKQTLSNNNHKIGLMYQSDYINAGPNEYKNLTNWLFIRNGLSTFSGKDYEWTMSRGIDNDDVFFVRSEGSLTTSLPFGGSVDAVRPVFYLISEISISGEGTESNPFIISDRIVS